MYPLLEELQAWFAEVSSAVTLESGSGTGSVAMFGGVSLVLLTCRLRVGRRVR